MPKYLFIGLALIVSGIGYLVFNSVQASKLKEAYIENPQVGDVYLIKSKEETSQYNHYLLKVRDITGDSLWISYSSFGYNGIVSQLDPKDGFYNVMYSMHKNGIKEYNESGELIKVIRDYSETSGFNRDIEFNEADSLEVN